MGAVRKFTIVDVEQGTDEWFQARLGKITASQFSQIITTTGKLSASHDEVINKCVAELILGEPEETFQSDDMYRGKELEQSALEFFNFTCGYEFKKVGFLDSGQGFGCSPDGLELDRGIGLELKCPLSHNHLSYLVGGCLPKKYMQQVQGSLLISGFEKWVFGSYHPQLPCFSVEVERDEKIIKPMEEFLIECAKKVQERYEKVSRIIMSKKE